MQKQKFSISLPVELLKEIKIMAKYGNRSVNGQITHMLKRDIEHRAKSDKLS